MNIKIDMEDSRIQKLSENGNWTLLKFQIKVILKKTKLHIMNCLNASEMY